MSTASSGNDDGGQTDSPSEPEMEEERTNVIGVLNGDDAVPEDSTPIDEIDQLLYTRDRPEPENDTEDIAFEESDKFQDVGDDAVLYNPDETIGLPDGLEEEELVESFIERELSVDDVYEEEELESYAEDISGYDGPMSDVPIVGGVLDYFLGEEVSPDDLNLDTLAARGMVEDDVHEAYIEFQEEYARFEDQVEDYGTVIVPQESLVGAVASEQLGEDRLEAAPEGYFEVVDGELNVPESQIPEDRYAEQLAAQAVSQYGEDYDESEKAVEQLYSEIEDSDRIDDERAQDVRDTVEEIAAQMYERREQ